MTTKALKKHSSRPVGGAEMESRGGEDWGTWQTGHSHICMWVNREEQLRSKIDPVTQGYSMGK